MEFMYLVFTRMPCESYRRRLIRSLLLYLCYVFWALINSLVCWFSSPCLSKVLAACTSWTAWFLTSFIHAGTKQSSSKVKASGWLILKDIAPINRESRLWGQRVNNPALTGAGVVDHYTAIVNEHLQRVCVLSLKHQDRSQSDRKQSGLCCRTCVTFFEHWLTPLCVDSPRPTLPKSCFQFVHGWCTSCTVWVSTSFIHAGKKQSSSKVKASGWLNLSLRTTLWRILHRSTGGGGDRFWGQRVNNPALTGTGEVDHYTAIVNEHLQRVCVLSLKHQDRSQSDRKQWAFVGVRVWMAYRNSRSLSARCGVLVCWQKTVCRG